MTTTAQREKHEQWLRDVTALPTAAGQEWRVVEWVKRWVAERRNLKLRTDPSGNLIITIRPKPGTKRPGRRPLPIYLTAHLDHPAFVVKRRIDEHTLELEFRGGVHPPYFDNAPIEIFDAHDRIARATITNLDAKAKPFKLVIARLDRPATTVGVGDVARWRFTGKGRTPVIDDKGIFHTPACDDLAAVAAALSTLDLMRNRANMDHFGVLLTLAEEVGFIGAIEACEHRSVPKSSRLVCLENSRSFPESPIGGGPIVRVGDRISVFDPRLTNRISDLMFAYAKRHPEYRWQRKLMAGGMCEASAFSEYGYESTCLCLPLGNYHNMRDIDGVLAGKRPAKVAPECIAIADYHGFIEMLVEVATRLDKGRVEDVMSMMKRLRRERRHVLRA